MSEDLLFDAAPASNDTQDFYGTDNTETTESTTSAAFIAAEPEPSPAFDMDAFRQVQAAPEPAPFVPPVTTVSASEGPTPMQKFNTERRERLEQISEAEVKKRNEALAKGKAEFEKFKQERANNVSAAALRVKDEEKTFVAGLVSSGNMWETVLKMIDNEQKGKKDVSRMRSVMIQVKNSA
eukprot:c11468_g1_i2.p1 GENE.c11468_g1_i2~~c11468_g1_i2.p1  ORF type:complete len:181 (+),score=25.40 c11468_g1_i2:83-625(+)